MIQQVGQAGLTAAKLDPDQANTLAKEARGYVLDVRGFDEFAAGHASGAICIPLPDLARRVGELPTDRPIVVMCQSGHRSQIAVAKLRSLGMDNVSDITGGFAAWRKAGLPMIGGSNVFSLERQVRIAAGSLVLVFSLAGFLCSPLFFAGSTLIGFMLALTGTLGVCPMMSLLKLFPWNRPASV